MKNKYKTSVLTSIAAYITICTNAQAITLIDFEVGETYSTTYFPAPFTSKGYSIASTSDQSAILDPSLVQMLGNSTDFFGFSETNTITISSGSVFSLFSLDIGINSLADNPTTDFTIRGKRNGSQADLVTTVTSISSSQNLELNWSSLTSVIINITDDSGIDNITVSSVPEPSSSMLLSAVAMFAFLRRTRN